MQRDAPEPSARRRRVATPAQRLLTLPQADEQFGIPPRTLYDLIARGMLPVIQFEGGRRLRIDRSDLEKLIAASKETR